MVGYDARDVRMLGSDPLRKVLAERPGFEPGTEVLPL
jgi:hypothetical protein